MPLNFMMARMIDCSQCVNKKNQPAACCQEIVIKMDVSGDLGWWGEMRWMVAHEKVSVAREIETEEWVVIFETPCSKLSPEGRCTIYETRPKICQDYSEKSCIINGEGEIYDLYFNSIEEIDAYMNKEVLEDLKKENKRSLVTARRDQWQLNQWPKKR